MLVLLILEFLLIALILVVLVQQIAQILVVVVLVQQIALVNLVIWERSMDVPCPLPLTQQLVVLHILVVLHLLAQQLVALVQELVVAFPIKECASLHVRVGAMTPIVLGLS